jgi:MATE family multidrug resistance protein
MSSAMREVRKLASLALPVMAAQFGSMLLGTVDTMMVGRVSGEALAAAAIANAWIYGLILIGQGLIHGIDPLVTQFHGAGGGARVGLVLQRGLVVGAIVGVPLGALLMATEPFLLFVGQDPELAHSAHRYALVQAPSLPLFLLFMALRQYLNGREIVRPGMWVMLFANLFNGVANWALIFGHLGLPELGLYGAGIATALTRGMTLIAMVGLIWGFSLHEGAWQPWSRQAFDPRALGRIVRFGFPVAIQMSLEVWAFSAATLLAGRLGAGPAAAHSVVLNMASLAFMLPLGISQGAVTRVGNLLGANRPVEAQHAGWVAIALASGVMTLSALLFAVFRFQLPALYTADAELIGLAAAILPIAAAFQIFDGAQVAGCGVLRGMGRPAPAAWLNLFGYWVIALPLGAWLVLVEGWELAGIWWGLCAGLATVAVGLMAWLRFRGPAHGALILTGVESDGT